MERDVPMKKRILSALFVLIFMVVCLSVDASSGLVELCPAVPASAAGKTAEKLAVPSNSGALQVIGADLCDEKGNPVQLRGISTHGLAWFPDYVNNSLFKELRESWNVNVVRLAMYTHEYGGYCSGGDKENLKKLVKNGVKYATDNDMYVIVDWHVLNDRDPNLYKKEAKEFFKEISKEFSSNNNVIYEICNEPNGNVSWSSIKSYAQEIIPVIRKYSPNAIIIVGTPTWSQEVDKAAANPVKGYDNIMYALHFYAATHKSSLRNTMRTAAQKGLPIFVTEYGICDASGNGAIDKTEADKWVKAMNELNISYVNWSLSNKAESASLISSDCNKKSGLSMSNLSESGKWVYSMLTGKNDLSAVSEEESAPGTESSSGSESSSGNESANDNGNSSGNESAQGSDSPDSDGTQVVTVKSKTLKITAKLVNSWEAQGRKYYQYSFSVTNKSKKTKNSWAASIRFNRKYKLEECWNASFSSSGKKLTIKSTENNGRLESGASASDIGIIVSCTGTLKIK